MTSLISATGGTATIADLVEAYIGLRHGLGYWSVTQDRAQRAFARHLAAGGRQEGPIPLEATLGWATAVTASAAGHAARSVDATNPARRLATIRGLLRHLHALDGETDVPAAGMLGRTGQRTPPHIYTDAEIADLIGEAGRLDPVDGLRPHCYATLFGLLACTGLRISEALGLDCTDVDLDDGVLTVRAGKRGLTRLVPLHPTAVGPLAGFVAERQRHVGAAGPNDSFFRTEASERISYNTAHHAFVVVRRRLGWDDVGRVRAPRIHDLRHRMVVRRILAWHVEGVDVDARLAVLATYLGHIEVRDTYWYLSAVPELMDIASVRFEADRPAPQAEPRAERRAEPR